jgi:hypothetical protein
VSVFVTVIYLQMEGWNSKRRGVVAALAAATKILGNTLA